MRLILKRPRQKLLVLLLLSITSCNSSPRALPIEPPNDVMESVIQEASSDPLFEANVPIPTNWWTLFNDEQLSQFIQTTLEKNPTLKQAQTKILLAQASADQIRATLYPNIYWGGDVSRQKLSKTGLGFPPGSSSSTTAATSSAGFSPVLPKPIPGTIPLSPNPPSIPVYFTQWETELSFYYDFDIWSKNRNTLRAAIGEVYSNIADEAFSRLQLSISVAQVYYQLQIDYKRQEIAKALVENQNRYLELVQKRLELNLAAQQPVYNTQLSVTTAKQSLLQIQGDIAVREYQLKAYLAGSFDEDINNIEVDEQPLPRVPLPQDIPLHLIAHRPDITAQLWLIESAGKRIDVARAGFYPDFNLTGLVGFQSLRLHELFQARSTYFNVDPAFSLPIFDGGRLIANLHSSEVNYDLAIYQYNNLVLNAAREVLEGIAVLRNSELQLNELKKNLEYQQELFTLTRQLIENNLNSDLDYLVSQQSVLIAQDQEIITLGNMIQALLSLIKALGGGYEDGC